MGDILNFSDHPKLRTFKDADIPRTADILNISSHLKFKAGTIPVATPQLELDSYLITMNKNLSHEDYLDFLEACLCANTYQKVDEDIQDFVDGFFNTKASFVG